MALYPISLEIKNKLCVVVGGGDIAFRKIKGLLDAGAKVKVVALKVTKKISELKGVLIVNKEYEIGDLKNAYLVIAATNDEDINRKIAKEARENNFILNTVDNPRLCDFYVPSVVRRGDLLISISTSGKFPGVAKKLKENLEKQYGKEYDEYLAILAQARDKVILKYDDVTKRRAKLEEIVSLPLIGLIKQGKTRQVKKEIEKII